MKTIQLQLLQTRLAGLSMQAQRMLADSHARPAPVGWRCALDALPAELRRVLRQLDAARRIADAAAAAYRTAGGAASGEPRSHEPSAPVPARDEMAAVCRAAARLADLLVRLRPAGGGFSSAGLAQAVHRIGTETGRPLDQTAVLRTLHRASVQPAAPPLAAACTQATQASQAAQTSQTSQEVGGLRDTLSILLAMVAALADNHRATPR